MTEAISNRKLVMPQSQTSYKVKTLPQSFAQTTNNPNKLVMAMTLKSCTCHQRPKHFFANYTVIGQEQISSPRSNFRNKFQVSQPWSDQNDTPFIISSPRDTKEQLERPMSMLRYPETIMRVSELTNKPDVIIIQDSGQSVTDEIVNQPCSDYCRNLPPDLQREVILG